MLWRPRIHCGTRDIDARTVSGVGIFSRGPRRATRRVRRPESVAPQRVSVCLRGAHDEGAGGHWWHRLTASELLAHPLPEHVGNYRRPEKWVGHWPARSLLTCTGTTYPASSGPGLSLPSASRPEGRCRHGGPVDASRPLTWFSRAWTRRSAAARPTAGRCPSDIRPATACRGPGGGPAGGQRPR